METNQWWYESKGEQNGPVDEDEIRKLIGYGLLKKENLVWTEGMAAWAAVSTTKFNEFVSDPQQPVTINNTETSKWYNNKTKFWFSVLLWPLFLYGLYKTALYEKKKKQIIAAIAVVLIFISVARNGGGSSSLRQDPWDNSVTCVELYLKYHYLNDPDSYESIKWGKATTNADGTYEVIHSFRARNGFGGVVKSTKIFTISADGEHVIRVDN